MLEKMGEFFEARLNGYEDHQLTCIESARAFYPFTASCLPQTPNASILDLGCGTGLELDFYFKTVPSAQITGVDLAPGMLDELRRKHQEKTLTLIFGSYFDVPFEENAFDAAVSVESLHHLEDSAVPKAAKGLKAGRLFHSDGLFRKLRSGRTAPPRRIASPETRTRFTGERILSL